MLIRRHLRRTVITVVCLPLIVLSGLLIVDKKHNFILSRISTKTENLLNLNEIDQPVPMRIKRSTINTNEVETGTKTVNFDRRFHHQAMNYPFIYPVIDGTSVERFVHLDLKGAAPKIDYYQRLFPKLKEWGATGLLIEYEDMFPFTGRLASIRHGLAYSDADVDKLLRLAQVNGLKVMPLIQVYGHLEYVLKLEEFMHLREDKRYPQVITPCLEESYHLLFGKKLVSCIFNF